MTVFNEENYSTETHLTVKDAATILGRDALDISSGLRLLRVERSGQYKPAGRKGKPPNVYTRAVVEQALAYLDAFEPQA